MRHMIVSRAELVLGSLRLLVACVATAAVMFASDPAATVLPIAFAFALCLGMVRFDITNIWMAFSIPWLIILAFSAIDISDYSRAVSRETLLAIVAVLSIGLVLLPVRPVVKPIQLTSKFHVNERMFKILLFVYIGFCAINVALAGFVPLLSAVTQGDSRYMDFGVKGVYGLFNAFANAFGLTAFYLWMNNREGKIYKWSFFLVLAMFFVFVTRQNMVSLLIEAFLVYSVTVRRVSGVRIAILFLAMLFAFAAIGDFRVGVDIADIAAIKERFLWVPRAFIWLFAYCYFNILNLDNVIASSSSPTLDGSSAAQLLPSFLRPPSNESEDLLEVSSFTVDSFISPIYHDIGLIGLCAVFALFCLSVRWYIARRNNGDFFVGDTGYAVLYFCFFFSFFVNFWFYLPVIFQLAFLPMFKHLLFRNDRNYKAKTQ